MDRRKTDKIMTIALKTVKGILEAVPFSSEDIRKILDIERDAEKKAIMGLGSVINSGVREVLNCELIYVALTNMDFSWGDHASLIMKKGDELVGEEVQNKKRIAELSKRKDVWFMHQNFVIYKDKVSFPKDLMKKICHFEIPSLPTDWHQLEDWPIEYRSIIYANPSTPCDNFLKKRYFDGIHEKGLGTILVGVAL
ncbi:hypothetical protein QUF90_26095 [Desulfococcaceae bacterium HSG9]|nr:hypothetical protein [Desulfococcaceae bacterium HSG9]